VGFFSVRPSDVWEEEEEVYMRSSWDQDDSGEPPVIRFLSLDAPPDAEITVITSEGSSGTKTNTIPVFAGESYLVTVHGKVDACLLYSDDPASNVVYAWEVSALGGETVSGSKDLQTIRKEITPEIASKVDLENYLLAFFWVTVPYPPPETPAPIPEQKEGNDATAGEKE